MCSFGHVITLTQIMCLGFKDLTLREMKFQNLKSKWCEIDVLLLVSQNHLNTLQFICRWHIYVSRQDMNVEVSFSPLEPNLWMSDCLNSIGFKLSYQYTHHLYKLITYSQLFPLSKTHLQLVKDWWGHKVDNRDDNLMNRCGVFAHPMKTTKLKNLCISNFN